jgi:pilus assembly protein FimV
MFRKRISSLLVALVALDATSALGLGLGEITLRSALNEPLKAEIRLRGTDDLGSDQIIVRLASSADFDRSGIERLYALTEMRFEVKTAASGEGVVYLRTDQPVREPYMDFLLEVRWPNGRVLREYTVLLDLPTYTTAPPPR